jgi:type VII secretion-associated serine protease mycosin
MLTAFSRTAGALTLALLLAAIPAAAGARAVDTIRDSQQWVLNMMNVPTAWQVTTGQGVTIAVLDSGVVGDVTDLTGSVRPGPDFTGLGTPPSDPTWGMHGTWMASIVAGHGHDGGGSGVMGIAPAAKVLSIRVIPDHNDPRFKTYDKEPESRIQQSLATAIRDAVDDGARVISMSIGYAVPSGAVRAALLYAYAKGAVVVASSGNSGADDESRNHGFAPVSFPADYPGVVGVGAVNDTDSVANFSSANLSVLVAAPGVNVPAQGRDGQYWLVSGTSPACALVAGVAALIKSQYPRLTPDLVVRALTSTTTARPPGGYNVKVGFGTVDAAAALTAAGRLAGQRGADAAPASTVRFGGGPAAVPHAPVSPRGVGGLILFVILAVASLALAVAAGNGLVVLRRGRHVAGAYGAAFAGPGAQAEHQGPPDPFRFSG